MKYLGFLQLAGFDGSPPQVPMLRQAPPALTAVSARPAGGSGGERNPDGEQQQQAQQQPPQQQNVQSAPSGQMPLSDEAVRRGVNKLFASLRKSYSAQQRQRASEAAAANAARLRRELGAQAQARAALVAAAPAAALLEQLGGLPSAAARGSGAGAWDRPRAEAHRWEEQQGEGRAQEQEQQQEDEEEGGDAHSTRPVPAQLLGPTKGALNYVGGKGVPLQAFILPTIAGVPSYKTWIHVKGSVLSMEIGKRMFYTDEKGETVPVSDDEADVEAQLDQRALSGIHRLKHDYVLREVVAQFGTGPAVFEALEDKMGVSAAALEARATALAAEAAGLAPAQQELTWQHKQDLKTLESDIYASWCRRCRSFGCRIHKGGHLRPVLGPMKEEKKAGRAAAPAAAAAAAVDQQAAQQQGMQQEPCGSECYLAQPQGALGAAPAPALPAAAAAGAAGADELAEPRQPGPQQQQRRQGDHVSYASSPVPVPGSGLLSLKRRRSDAHARLQQPQPPQQQRAKPGEQGDSPDQEEVTSPPAKQRGGGASPIPPPSQHAGKLGGPPPPAAAAAAGGVAAAAAAAAAANVPARRRRNGGSSGGEPGPGPGPGAAAAAAASPPRPPPAAAAGAAQEGAPWSPWEDSLLQQGLEVWGRQPCKVAPLVGSRTCREVHKRMQELCGGESDGDGEEEAEEGQQPRKGKGRKMARAQVKPRKVKPAAVYERSKRPTNERWPQYYPCDCQGACKSDCPCAHNANFCEKFCACDPAKCGNRFAGCTCKCGATLGRRCSSKQCPCLAAGRECDPDLCKSCKPTLTGENKEGWQCNNFRIRLGQKRRVLMGLSDIQGWGAFLQQAAQKDEFVGEYCGELIDHEEADRRGIVYDRDDNSYLFDLNKEWVIDARQRGNTLRFANHSTNANCRAQILTVDGDHRVAIVASRDVAAGDELFYNYNYDKRVAPDWAVTEQQWKEQVHAAAAAKKNAVKRQGGRGGGGSERDKD